MTSPVHRPSAARGWRLAAAFLALALAAPGRAADETTNSLGMVLVAIPAGEFLMGGVEPPERLVEAYAAYGRKADYFADEYPRHRVRITRPFRLGKYEVTVGQFRAFVEATGYQTEPERDGQGAWGFNPAAGKCEGRRTHFSWKNPGFLQTDDYPVLNVTWNDAVAFCRWLSSREGKTYRLPTEAEWEYACRAGSRSRYNSGDDPGQASTQANILDDGGQKRFPHVQEIFLPRDARFTLPVGRYPPNAFGLCDMHGNVWEWVADWYAADYYARSPLDDPRGPDEGQQRVRRGGAWNSWPLWARASFRNWNTPQSRCVNLGFRVLQEK